MLLEDIYEDIIDDEPFFALPIERDYKIQMKKLNDPIENIKKVNRIFL